MITIVRGNLKVVSQDGEYIDPANPFSVDNALFRMEFAYTSESLLEYIGRAVPNTITSLALWEIRQFVYDASSNLLQILWADGNKNFDNIWDDRTSLSYS